MSAAEQLTLVGASAGSGKTHRLTDVVVQAVDPSQPDSIGPEALAAVTYTRRAAAELTARIRRTLVSAGAHDRAQQLPLAYLGTVHAVCLRLVQEFALDAGLSPQVDVLPGDEARWLREALESGLDPDFRSQMQTLADCLELRWDARTRRTDWLTPVQDVMTLARSNRIAATALAGMSERSIVRLLALLGPADPDGEALDRALLAALETVDRDLGRIDDGFDKTGTARDTVRDALRSARAERLLWSDWVRLQNLSPAKKVIPTVAPVVQAALRVDGHPRLHSDLRRLTHGIYEAARQGLEAYDGWKRRRRVVDFVDMVDRALTLTERPEVKEELGNRLRLLVVDEFQDTSPVQLGLFVRLHEIARQSTWVGDRKQCIFEFAGADPSLMEAVSTWVAGAGGATPRLESNWRSRPEIVDACSALFAAAFLRHGYRPEDVVVKAVRTTPDRLADLPPWGLWWLDAGSQSKVPCAIAEGVRRLLENPAITPVVDRPTNEVRDLRAGDIAILVATNKEASDVAAELARRGVRATVARAGLLSTPEGTLVQAALSALIDPRASLPRAVIDALTGFGEQGAEAWLDARLTAEAARAVARERGEEFAPIPSSEPVARLDALRPLMDVLAPSEALDSVLAALDAPTLCARWPDPEQRLSNLDALRALAAAYEERCAYQREAATIAGLLRFFEESAKPRLVRDEEIASDDQHVGSGDQAVTIATYHKAKGLEWPVVILSSLDRGERRDAFEVSPETDRTAFDATDPLGDRWIRYWPWPFGQQQKTHLADAAANSPEGTEIAKREERERVRLLYVGFTRARDHLILAARVTAKGPAVRWLNELCDGEGRPLLGLPATCDGSEESLVEIRDLNQSLLKVRARHWLLGTGSDSPVRLPNGDSHVWFARAASPAAVRPPYWISPSLAISDWPDLVVPQTVEVQSIGERLPIGDSPGVDWEVVGNAVHAFLAADVPDLEAQERFDRARRLLSASSIETVLDPAALVRAGDQLRAWVASHWPNAIWHREYPVTAVVSTQQGTRRVQGTIDLLLETPEGNVIVDHKSFPGGPSQWAAKAGTYAPQLAAYAHVLSAAGRRVLGLFVHFTLGGGVARLR
ncbi:MAG: UvrD-helicase domain-containing protein [Polyangiaceae bacterium]